MALITCKECKAEVSNQAASCPKCGAPIKKSGMGWGCMITALILTLLFVLFGIDDHSSEKTGPGKRLFVSLQKSRYELVVTNDNSAEAGGQSVVIYINGRPPFTYKSTIIFPQLGQETRIRLDEFIMKDGKRFDTHSLAVTEIWIGGGEGGYDFISYK